MARRVAAPWFWILTGPLVAVWAYFVASMVWLVLLVVLNAVHQGPFTEPEDLMLAVILTTPVIWVVSMVGISRLMKANAAEAGRRTHDQM